MISCALVSTQYKDDTRWSSTDPSLGWSFWSALAAGVLAIVSGGTFSIRGQQEFAQTKRRWPKSADVKGKTKVHPSGKQLKLNNLPKYTITSP